MEITLSVIKADIGSIGGHLAPSQALLESVRGVLAETASNLLIDWQISHTGDDIALLLTHMHAGRFSEPQDCFAHPFWDHVRDKAAAKAIEMRRQGFFGAAMLPMSELEYTGITQRLAALSGRFRQR